MHLCRRGYPGCRVIASEWQSLGRGIKRSLHVTCLSWAHSRGITHADWMGGDRVSATRETKVEINVVKDIRAFPCFLWKKVTLLQLLNAKSPFGQVLMLFMNFYIFSYHPCEFPGSNEFTYLCLILPLIVATDRSSWSVLPDESWASH